METALTGISEFDDVQAHLLEPEESLDSEQTGIDLDEGYSPPERPRELRAWGLTAREARTHESLARRLTREVPDVTDQWDGDGLGDSADSDGEPIDNQVGDMRAGRLVTFGIDSTDSSNETPYSSSGTLTPLGAASTPTRVADTSSTSLSRGSREARGAGPTLRAHPPGGWLVCRP